MMTRIETEGEGNSEMVYKSFLLAEIFEAELIEILPKLTNTFLPLYIPVTLWLKMRQTR